RLRHWHRGCLRPSCSRGDRGMLGVAFVTCLAIGPVLADAQMTFLAQSSAGDAQAGPSTSPSPPPDPQSPATQRMRPAEPIGQKGRDFAGALVDSLKLVSLEHVMRITFQEKTRAELGGPFWSDYVRSVRVPQQWDDTDRWYVNYVGHPIHGAGAGIIW